MSVGLVSVFGGMRRRACVLVAVGGGDTIKYVRAFLVGSFLAQLLDHLGGALVQFVEVRPLIHVHAAPGVAADAPQSGVQITEWHTKSEMSLTQFRARFTGTLTGKVCPIPIFS